MEKLELDPAWKAIFEEQVTSPSMSRVHAYAANRARLVCAATGVHDELLARELVLDAIADTFLGEVAWNPSRAPLVAHLFRVISGRTAKMLARCAEYPHIALDNEPRAELDEQASVALGGSPSIREELAARQVVNDVVVRTRELAGDDELVLRLLDALEAGALTREHVLRDGALSESEYHNARRRLTRLLQLLPREVRGAVVALFTNGAER